MLIFNLNNIKSNYSADPTYKKQHTNVKIEQL